MLGSDAINKKRPPMSEKPTVLTQLSKLFAKFFVKFFELLKKSMALYAAFVDKGTAKLLYWELCAINWIVKSTIGRIFYVVCLLYGFYESDEYLLKWVAVLISGYLVEGVITFRLLFKSKSFEEWMYKHNGRERVRKVVFTSPAMGAATKFLSKATLGAALGSTAIATGCTATGALGCTTIKFNADRDCVKTEAYAERVMERKLSNPHLGERGRAAVIQEYEDTCKKANDYRNSVYQEADKVLRDSARNPLNAVIDSLRRTDATKSTGEAIGSSGIFKIFRLWGGGE